jgi:activator of HSP90 ATPase
MPDFKKYFDIPAPPDEVYRALTNPLALQLWTGGPVEFEAVPGTEFALWDDSICGCNLEFVEDKMIKQEWYFGEEVQDSIVTIKLHAKGQTTSMEVQHVNIPAADYNDIVGGWQDLYIASLINFFKED